MPYSKSVCLKIQSCLLAKQMSHVYNFHNKHIWSNINPQGIHATHSQEQFSVNLWTRILRDYLTPPFLLSEKLNEDIYSI